jgi:hypothetical protein
VILWEDGEVGALSGGFADESSCALEVGAGIEGLASARVVSDLVNKDNVELTNLGCQLYQCYVIYWCHTSFAILYNTRLTVSVPDPARRVVLPDRHRQNRSVERQERLLEE